MPTPGSTWSYYDSDLSDYLLPRSLRTNKDAYGSLTLVSYIFRTNGTAIPGFDRRRPYGGARDISNSIQRKKNARAVALLKSWLSDEQDSTAESESLQETIFSLNESRSTSRKLFP